MKTHKMSLEKQIESGKSKDTPMGPHEYQLNKQILDVIEKK
jgi:hypothetical protein